MKNLFIEREDLDDDLGSCGLRGRHLTAHIEPGLGDVQRMNVDDRQSDDRRLVRRLSLVLLAFVFLFLLLLLSTAALLFSSLCHDRRYLRSIRNGNSSAVLCDAVGVGSAMVGASGQKLPQIIIHKTISVWLGGRVVSDLRSTDRGFELRTPPRCPVQPGQVVYAHVPLSASSIIIIWYRPTGGDDRRLGR